MVLSVKSEIAVMIMVRMRFNTGVYYVKHLEIDFCAENFRGICPLIDNLFRTKNFKTPKNEAYL